MSEVIFLKCDTCGKIAGSDNHYKEGWISVDGEISVGTKRYSEKKGCYISQWIQGDRKHHFCSWKCLMEHDDNNQIKKRKVVKKCQK